MGDSLEDEVSSNLEDSGIVVPDSYNNAENFSIAKDETDHVIYHVGGNDNNKGVHSSASLKRRHTLTPDKELAQNDKAETSVRQHEEVEVKRCCGQNIDTEDSTLEYELSEGSHTNSLDENKEEHATTADNGMVGTQEDVPKLNKIESVQTDAKHIASILQRCDIDTIYEKVKENRQVPNRLEKVTNDLLEDGNKEDQTVAADKAGTSQTTNQQSNETKESESKERIFADVGRVLFILKGKCPGRNINPDKVIKLLETHSQEKNRVSLVVEALVNKVSDSEGALVNKVSDSEGEPQGDILDNVDELRQAFPNVDPNEIFALLEKYEAHPNRKAKVKEEISKAIKDVESTANNSQSETDPLAANDPLYKDMKIIAKMFPEKDQNEIYALLEAYYQDPKRIEIVTNELLLMQQGSQDPDDAPMLGASQGEGRSIVAIKREVQTLMAIFPDCDPDYLFESLEAMGSDPNRVDSLSSTMFENKTYPKLQDRIKKQKNATLRKRLQTMNINIPEFLEIFPDPETEFTNETKTMSENYKRHALTQLKNTFSDMHFAYIQKVFEEHHCRYSTTLIQLVEELRQFIERQERHGQIHNSKQFRKRARTEIEMFPDEPDEYFYKELQYTQSKDAIKTYVEEQKQAKEQRLQSAREKGELNECGCCFDDEVLFEDMGTCTNGHLFCKECIKRSSEEVIGQGKIEFPCLSGDCKSNFDHTTLKGVLSKKIFSNLLKKIQEEEIKQADIPDLVSCPFCPFATIITDDEDKVFKCYNPECLKESCRLCKESNHIPLKCEEVEKQGETNMRVYIEKKITEAMLRTCWKCSKRFFKTEGCNKMTCTCGAHMCYVCRQPIRGYDHFTGPNACPQDTDIHELHKQEMEKAGQEAKEHFLKEHPEAADTELKHDPLKLIEKGQRITQQPGFGLGRRLPPGLYPFANIDHEDILPPPAPYFNVRGGIPPPVPPPVRPAYITPYGIGGGGGGGGLPHNYQQQQHVPALGALQHQLQHHHHQQQQQQQQQHPNHYFDITQQQHLPQHHGHHHHHHHHQDQDPRNPMMNRFNPVDNILNRPQQEIDLGYGGAVDEVEDSD